MPYDLLEKNYKSFVSLWEIAIKLAVKKIIFTGSNSTLYF